ncbi:PH domain-containing protein [Bacillus sp. S14(2024)]|uniref:PH domain-containing protein n=1 Tax=Bacillus sp. S14(2024) TaxID=3162884 RepID=UPI003D1AAE07
MKWKVRRDREYWYMMVGTILLSNTLLSLPLWLDKTLNSIDWIIIPSIILIFDLFMLWVIFGIRYELREKSLYARCGPFWCNVPYENITGVHPTDDMLMGFRPAAAFHGVEIHYPNALFGSVKLSPENEELFIKTLLAKCPHLQNSETKHL